MAGPAACQERSRRAGGGTLQGDHPPCGRPVARSEGVDFHRTEVADKGRWWQRCRERSTQEGRERAQRRPCEGLEGGELPHECPTPVAADPLPTPSPLPPTPPSADCDLQGGRETARGTRAIPGATTKRPDPRESRWLLPPKQSRCIVGFASVSAVLSTSGDDHDTPEAVPATVVATDRLEGARFR